MIMNIKCVETTSHIIGPGRRSKALPLMWSVKAYKGLAFEESSVVD